MPTMHLQIHIRYLLGRQLVKGNGRKDKSIESDAGSENRNSYI
jgi:hypothetical protein